MTPQRIYEIFHPRASETARVAKECSQQFVYYTTADVAFQIIRNKEIWMRNTTTMNDYSEVQYGIGLLNRTLNGPAGAALKTAVDACLPNVYDQVRQQFQSLVPHYWLNTFITCFSEHDSKEDNTGRLSMWRAYGGKSGVALIFSGTPFFLDASKLAAYASPVAYLTESEFASEVVSLANNISTHQSALQLLGPTALASNLHSAFRFAVLCTKHVGFKEEREWRVIASPAIQNSKYLRQSNEVVRGTPQPVVKISLADDPQGGLIGLELAGILDRVIVGPCDFPLVTRDALADELGKVGAINPANRIVISEIPLRHS